MELTLICVGEKNKVKSLRELVAFQHELIIFTANEEIAAEVRDYGFESAYSCNKEKDFTSMCTRIKKVILLGDELPTVSFFTEHIRFSFQAPITVVTRNKRYPARSMKQLELNLSCLRTVIIFRFYFLNRAGKK